MWPLNLCSEGLFVLGVKKNFLTVFCKIRDQEMVIFYFWRSGVESCQSNTAGLCHHVTRKVSSCSDRFHSVPESSGVFLTTPSWFNLSCFHPWFYRQHRHYHRQGHQHLQVVWGVCGGPCSLRKEEEPSHHTAELWDAHWASGRNL